MAPGAGAGGYTPFRPTSALDDPARVPDDFVVPTLAELDAMDMPRRRQTMVWLITYDSEMGTDHVGNYRRERERCPELDEFNVRCPDRKFEGMGHCLRHATLDELAPGSANARKVAAAKAKLADAMDRAADELINIIELDAEQVTAQVRLNAIALLFDRAGLPKESKQEIDARAEVHVTGPDPGQIIRDRIQQLADAAAATAAAQATSARNEETPELEAGDAEDDVVEGVVVDA